MRKEIMLLITIVVVVSGLVVLKRIKQPTVKAAYTVGILQTASHPALDASRDGFIEELKNRLGDAVEFVV